jgi:hypothetical protein
MGRVTSQLFRPTPKDENAVSVYDGDQISAEDAWRHYTEVQKLDSVGVLAVTVDECKCQALSIVADPAPYPEHVLIKFDNKLSNSAVKSKALCLKVAAETRGWQYP